MKQIKDYIPEQILEIQNTSKFIALFDAMNLEKAEVLSNIQAITNPFLTKNFEYVRKYILDASNVDLPSETHPEILRHFFINLFAIQSLKGTKKGIELYLKAISDGDVLIDMSQLYAGYPFITPSVNKESAKPLNVGDPSSGQYGLFNITLDDSVNSVFKAAMLTPFANSQSFREYVLKNILDFLPFTSSNTTIELYFTDYQYHYEGYFYDFSDIEENIGGSMGIKSFSIDNQNEFVYPVSYEAYLDELVYQLNADGNYNLPDRVDAMLGTELFSNVQSPESLDHTIIRNTPSVIYSSIKAYSENKLVDTINFEIKFMAHVFYKGGVQIDPETFLDDASVLIAENTEEMVLESFDSSHTEGFTYIMYSESEPMLTDIRAIKPDNYYAGDILKAFTYEGMKEFKYKGKPLTLHVYKSNAPSVFSTESALKIKTT
ncbi:hypothetical protein [Flammeovirga agarivorans]|uniref:Uncharacterized protein n=1 Tax=Flammeovirga agarivorans TaxID=2726742 RepID=A0A7X8SR58_9BACT|nr:hypothetical protein [Flammeovirga agarivorans]NLR94855.1 hypothetical protein [Flammeovirga agarivorans]